MEPPLAQILVVVANIRMRSWMTEVEEGFVSTAVEHELANPKLSFELTWFGRFAVALLLHFLFKVFE